MTSLAWAAAAFAVDLIYGLLNVTRWRAAGFTLWILSLIAVPVAVMALIPLHVA